MGILRALALVAPGLLCAGPARAVTLQPGDVVVAAVVNISSSWVPRILRLNAATLDTVVISQGPLVTIPQGVAVDRLGRILVADADAGIVLVDAPTGLQTVLAGKGPLGGSPAGICVAADGSLFVSVRGAAPGVVQVSSDGLSVVPVTGGNLISYPGGLALGPDGALYVTEGALPPDNGTISGNLMHGSIVRVDVGSGGQTMIAADSLFIGPFEIAFVGPDEVWTAHSGGIAGRLGCIIRTRLSDGVSEPVQEVWSCRSRGIAVVPGDVIVVGDCHTIGPDCYTPFTMRIPGGQELNGVAGRMAVVPQDLVPTPRPSWGKLKTIYR